MVTVYQKLLRRLGLAKPLALELAEACEAVQGLRKDGYNEEEDFAYLKILDLANQFRAELMPRGIVIIPNDLECVETSWELDGQMVDAIRVRTEFEITDGQRRLVKVAYGCSRNGNYAIAVAQTMALKSFLKRLGLIFGEEDDAEAKRWPGEKRSIRSYQERALDAALRSCGLTARGAEALLSKRMGRPMTLGLIATLPRKEFDTAISALSHYEDMAEILEMSKVELKKPQPIVKVMDQAGNDLAGD